MNPISIGWRRHLTMDEGRLEAPESALDDLEE